MEELPIFVRYFQTYDLKNPAKNKLLTFVEISGETVHMISMQVMKAIDNYNLEKTVVGLSADNTNSNFGGLLRRSKENMFTKIKSQLDRNIIVFGCSADIIRNCASQLLIVCL
jgi:hypothetical protein